MRNLWIQEKTAAGEILIVKVKGEDNWADALTKYLDNEKLANHRKLVNHKEATGRHAMAPSMGQQEKPDAQEGWQDEDKQEKDSFTLPCQKNGADKGQEKQEKRTRWCDEEFDESIDF